jgi:DNA-binding transcriptional regulator YbjK
VPGGVQNVAASTQNAPAGGGSWAGVVQAVGNGISGAFAAAAEIEGRAAAARFAAEGRSAAWGEALDIQAYEREIADLDRRIQDEQRQLLQQGRQAVESEELRLLREQRQRAVDRLRQETEAIHAAEGRRIRIPGWGWVLIGVGAIGGVFALIAWRATAKE